MDYEDRRTLSDADIEAISDKLEEKIIGQFYRNLGSGVWALVWRGLILLLISIAIYGASRG